MSSGLLEADRTTVPDRHSVRVPVSAGAVPAVTFLVVFFLAPIATFVVYSFFTPGLFSAAPPFTLDNYRDVLTADVVRQLALNSLVIGSATAGICVLLAIPVAYWLRYFAGRYQRIALFLVIITMLVSYLVRIFAWRAILGNDGVINSMLLRTGLIDQPLELLLYNKAAVVIALVHIMLPLVILSMFAAFRPITPALLDAANDLGASPIYRWTKVIAPLILPPALSSFVLVFALAAGDYVTPLLLGGTNGSTLGVLVQDDFKSTGDYAHGAASAISIAVVFLLLYGASALVIRLLKLNAVKWVD